MRWVRYGARILAWGLLALGVALFAALVVVPKANGWVPLTVLSGSMEPTYPVGSQVVVERVEGDEVADLRVGDVITFLPRPESATAVTHRIVKKSYRQDGAAVFTTRGDANNADDTWELTEQQIRGKVRYHVPYAGYLATALTQEKKDLGVIALAVALFGYAGWQFVRGAVGSRRSRRRTAEGPARHVREPVA